MNQEQGDLEQGEAFPVRALPMDGRRSQLLATLREEVAMSDDYYSTCPTDDLQVRFQHPEMEAFQDDEDSDGDWPPSSASPHSRYSSVSVPDHRRTTAQSAMEAAEEGRWVRRAASSSHLGLSRAQGQRDVHRRHHVQIRRLETAEAMSGRVRRLHELKKSLSGLLNLDSGLLNLDRRDDSNIRPSIDWARSFPRALSGFLHGGDHPSNRNVQESGREIKPDSASDIAGKEKEEEERDEKRRAETQYRLTAVGNRKTTVIPGVYEDRVTGEVTECCWCFPNVNPDHLVSSFLHWSFRSSFLVVFGTAAIGWCSMTVLFAFVIEGLWVLMPDCVAGIELAESNFVDALQLSWTTFSTVGYGMIGPATSHSNPKIHECVAMTVLIAYESFVGVVFSSLCAALMFAKVARAQSFAQVSFSDPIVIRYGSGVNATDGQDDDEDDADDNSKGGLQDPFGSNIPCPVLEFRIFNRLSDLKGGEIIDATVTMVAVIDGAQANKDVMGRSRRRTKDGTMRSATRIKIRQLQRDEIPLNAGEDEEQPPERNAVSVNDLEPSTPPEPIAYSIPETNPALRHRSPKTTDRPGYAFPAKRPVRSKFDRQQGSHAHRPSQRNMGPPVSARQHLGFNSSVATRFQNITGRREKQDSTGLLLMQKLNYVSMRDTNNQAFEEDPSGKILPKKILSKLDVDSPDHPFFRRVWLVKHTLDSNSLLLKPEAREMLQDNQGFWPEELNNYESIRDSIEFDQILISFSGTSNADAYSVYAQHVYQKTDLKVGYGFVSALYHDPDAGIRVDHSLINDVREQTGGGGEPLNEFNPFMFGEILVL